jgi:signal transduction histidine kinase/PAS domain-containing protein
VSSPPPVDRPDVDAFTILDRMEDGFFALDADWVVTYANERGREILRLAMTEIDADAPVEGQHLWDAIPAAVDTTFHHRYQEAMETNDPVSFEEWFGPLDTWFDVRAFPSASGLSVYFHDVTERKRLEAEREESLHALQRLYAVSSDRGLDFDEKLSELLSLGCTYLDVSDGFLSRIERGNQTIDASVGDHPLLESGVSCPVENSYCKRTVERDGLLTVQHAAEEGWVGDPAYERFGLATYIGGRVQVDGRLYGTLCFTDTAPRDEPFSETELAFVELLTAWVSHDLERQRTNAGLQRERDRLEEFAKVVSHDLRTPLNTAEGYANLLAGERSADDEYLDPLITALDRMDGMLEELLSLAQQGTVVDDPTPVALADVVEAAWETTDTASARLSIAAGTGRVLADDGRLQQLFENLFRNAVDHGGADVTVTVGPLTSRPGFFVADDGGGLPPDDRDRLFDAGYTTSETGTGFGLSIVDRIVTAHNWSIDVVDGDDEGARFEITGITRP